MASSNDKRLFDPAAQYASISGATRYVNLSQNGKSYLMREDQGSIRAREPLRWEQLPSPSGVTVTFGGTQQYVDFLLDPHDYEEIEHLSLRLQVTIANATSYFLPLPLCLDRMELTFSNSSRISQTLYGEQLYMNFGFLTNEQLSQVISGKLMNMTAGFAWDPNGYSVGTQYLQLPILGSVLAHFRYRILQGQTRIRFWFKQSIAVNGSSNANISFGNFYLVLSTENVLSPEVKAYEAMVNQNRLLITYCDVVRQQQTVTLAPSTRVGILLNAMGGYFAYLQIYIQKASDSADLSIFRSLAPGGTPPSAVGATSDTQYALVEYTDASGKNYITPGGYQVQELRYLEWARHFPGQLGSFVPNYVITFCESPVLAVMEGVIDGYRQVRNTDYIYLTPAANNFVSGADYTVNIVGWKIRHLEINRDFSSNAFSLEPLDT